MKILYPKLAVKRIYQVPISYFTKNNIKGLIIDLDNTLVPWDADEMAGEYQEWLHKVQDSNIKIVFISNNDKYRVGKFAKMFNVPFVSRAIKPLKMPFLKGQRLLEIPKENVGVVGDQIFTDTLGGNWAGLHTILVEPMSKKDFLGTKILRAMEKLVLSRVTYQEVFNEDE